ncbi:c-type cytochrome [Vulgatibacter incomptus]|uniref:Cytochrome c domain-containing protein n=1 Tax=Vulgatibacter incomptus TaxID=1391653 RepID=A0A0K1P9A4_9BACT|nr:cytochrome c [Vulgatibacter incomptus]AKU90001.1 hypothetical protein AKJ08_0388 [Vulgatibacter incomptus]
MRTLALGSLAPFAASLLLAPASASADWLLRGDADHGGQLFRMECASCHGVDGSGSDAWRKAITGKKELGTLPDLTDDAFMAQRSDAELRRAIRKGQGREGTIAGHAFSNLSSLDTWDLVEWLRADRLAVDDFFPGAAKFTAKGFQIDEYGAQRLNEKLKLQLAQSDLDVVVLTVYKGERKRNEGVRLVPWRPVDLDLLKVADRMGYLTFAEIAVPKTSETITVGLGLGTDGKLRKVMVRESDPAKRAAYEKILSAFVGQGGKGAQVYTAPKGLKDGDLWAKALTRAAGIAAEGVTMYEKAERSRTAFDR